MSVVSSSLHETKRARTDFFRWIQRPGAGLPIDDADRRQPFFHSSRAAHDFQAVHEDWEKYSWRPWRQYPRKGDF